MTMPTELKDRLLSRAAEGGEFRSSLIADPKAAISAEVGAPIPDGLDLVHHEV